MVVSVTVLGVLGILVLTALSAFFSSSETAIFSLSEPSSSDGPDDRALARLREDPHRLLVTILVGNNLVNVAITSIATVLLVETLPAGVAVTVTTVGVTTLVLVFGEIVPKAYGLGNAERWSLTVARPLALVERLLWPLVAVFDAVTRRLSAAIGGDADIEEPSLD
jgi:Mg2+/Co2+ transporter CorB